MNKWLNIFYVILTDPNFFVLVSLAAPKTQTANNLVESEKESL